MRIVLPALAALLLLPATASAAQVPDALQAGLDLNCRQPMTNYGPTGIPVYFTGDRGVLRFNTDAKGAPAGYDYDEAPLPERAPRAGGWSYAHGRITFESGPLAGQGTKVKASGLVVRGEVRMPQDRVRGRAFRVVLRTTGDYRGRWYCGRRGVSPRVLLKRYVDYVQRESGLPVRLPSYVRPYRAEGETGTSGRVRSLTRGAYRFQLYGTPCTAPNKKDCDVHALFGAHLLRGRAPYGGTPVRLARGIQGYTNTPGCGFNPGPHNFAPLLCGTPIVTWVVAGIEYSIQMGTPVTADLVRYANQAITGF